MKEQYKILVKLKPIGQRVIIAANKAIAEATKASIEKDGYIGRFMDDNIGVWTNPKYITSVEVVPVHSP